VKERAKERAKEKVSEGKLAKRQSALGRTTEWEDVRMRRWG
jgi:hypothetical protein